MVLKQKVLKQMVLKQMVLINRAGDITNLPKSDVLYFQHFFGIIHLVVVIRYFCIGMRFCNSSFRGFSGFSFLHL